MLRKIVLEFPRVCLASRSIGSIFASETLGMTSAAVRTAAPAALAIGLILVGAGDVVRSAEPAKPAGATVIVAKATKACFSASVQVTLSVTVPSSPGGAQMLLYQNPPSGQPAMFTQS